jgi:hypothetical protein
MHEGNSAAPVEEAMHPRQSLSGLLAFFAVFMPARAEAPAGPLALMPSHVHAVLHINRPRALVESFAKNQTIRKPLDALPELADYRLHRLEQLLTYFEKRLGSDRFDLLDQVAGGGIAAGIRFGPEPPAAVLVIRGRDEAAVHRFFQLAIELIEGELARQEVNDRPRRGQYRNLETVALRPGLFLAQAGAVLLASNVEAELHEALDLYLDGPKKSLAAKPAFADARAMIGPQSLAWGWLDLETVKKASGASDVFAARRNNAQLTVLFGGLLDVARRSPFVCAGLNATDDGIALTLQMPRGRQGMPPELAVHVPPPGQEAAPSLLEPRNVIFSSSFYLDIAAFFAERTKLFNARQVKAMEEFDKKSAGVLVGTPFSKLAAMAGPHQRVVVVSQNASVYKTAPALRLPAFAVVNRMREPEKFGKRMEVILRSAGLFAGFFARLKLAEEQHGTTHIIGYRFSEERKTDDKPNDILFNFSPCFARVGDNFVACSTVELCRELIDMLAQEGKVVARTDPVVQFQIYARGAASFLESAKDRIRTGLVLDYALPPDRATQTAETFLQSVGQLGNLRMESHYGPKDFHLNITSIPQRPKFGQKRCLDPSPRKGAAAFTRLRGPDTFFGQSPKRS